MYDFLCILHSLRSPVALESQESFLGFFRGYFPGDFKNKIRPWVMSSPGERGRVCSCEGLCCS